MKIVLAASPQLTLLNTRVRLGNLDDRLNLSNVTHACVVAATARVDCSLLLNIEYDQRSRADHN
jgi:hypothetical protein